MDESHDFGDHEYFGNESGSYLPLIRQYSVNEHTSRFSPPTPPSDPMPRMSRLLGVGRQPSSLPQGSARQDVPLGTSPGGHWNLPRGPAFPGLNDSGQYQPLRETDSVRTCSSAVFPQRITGPRKRALSEGECQLNRQGTLITPHADSKRASANLASCWATIRARPTRPSCFLRVNCQSRRNLPSWIKSSWKPKREERQGSKWMLSWSPRSWWKGESCEGG